METNNDIIFGIHPILEAIEADVSFDKVFIQAGLTGEYAHEIRKKLKACDIPFNQVPVHSLNKITRKNHQGVIGFISPISFYKIEDVVDETFANGNDPFIVILDGITDVRNFGAIVRTCEAIGVDAIVVPTKASARIASDAVKTSAGALFHIKICKTNSLSNTINYLKNSGLSIAGATEKGSELLYQSTLTGPIALIMGDEEEGINPHNLGLCTHKLNIPMHGKTGSLNVSVAFGIIGYEILRQRKFI